MNNAFLPHRLKNLHRRPWCLRCAQVLAQVIIPAYPSGFTFDPRALAIVDLRHEPDAYIVAICGHERPFPSIPGQSELFEWLSPRFEVFTDAANNIGGWSDSDVLYLDVATIIHGFESAIAFGIRNLQRSIYHPHSNTCIGLEQFRPAIRETVEANTLAVLTLDRN